MRYFFVLLLAALVPTSFAQEAVEVQTRVTFIAGQNVYVDVGEDAGLAENDTLSVARDGTHLGEMYVVSATASRAVLGFTGTPFPVTLGDHLVLVIESELVEQAEAQDEPAEETERPSILQQDAETQVTSTSAPVRLSGRLQIGLDGLMSSSSVNDSAPSTDYTFATPFALFRGELENLPGGVRLETQARVAYRYADPTPLDRETDVRVYRFSLEKSFDSIPLSVQAGRFYNRYERFSGYWDGLSLHVGNRQRGIGVSAGFQPEHSNEVPSGDFPKYTVFGHTSYDSEDVNYEGSVLGGQVLPTNQNLETRTFFGTHHRVSSRGIRASADALVDQDPTTSEWTLSRLGGQLSTTPSPGLRLRVFAQSRRPYILLGDRQDLLDRSTRYGGGASLSPRSGALRGATVRADVSLADTEGQPSTMTYSGGVYLPHIPALSVGFVLDGSLWMQDERQGLFGGISLSRSFGAVYTRVGYRYQQSPLLGLDDLITHGLEALLQIPIDHRTSFTMQASTHISDRTTSTRLYTSLWYRL